MDCELTSLGLNDQALKSPSEETDNKSTRFPSALNGSSIASRALILQKRDSKLQAFNTPWKALYYHGTVVVWTFWFFETLSSLMSACPTETARGKGKTCTHKTDMISGSSAYTPLWNFRLFSGRGHQFENLPQSVFRSKRRSKQEDVITYSNAFPFRRDFIAFIVSCYRRETMVMSNNDVHMIHPGHNLKISCTWEHDDSEIK